MGRPGGIRDEATSGGIQFAAVLLGLLVAAASFPPVRAAAPDVRCEGCHGGGPRIVFNPRTGTRRDIAIDLAARRRSAHGRLRCRECHTGRFTLFPHPRDRTTLRCLDCHPRKGRDAGADTAFAFPRIDREFRDSVHARRAGFRCESCHDPHRFRTIGAFPDMKAVLSSHNGPCLACHRRGARGALADPSPTGLRSAHAWLTRTTSHLSATRCIECHGEPVTRVSHRVSPSRETVRSCTLCHAADGLLALRAYRAIPPPAEDLGFLHADVLRDAYVLAATRNRLLDRISYLGGAAFLLLVGGCGMLRLRRATVRKMRGMVIPRHPWLRFWHAGTAVLFLVLVPTGMLLHFATRDIGWPLYDVAVRAHEIGGTLLVALLIPHFAWLAASGAWRRYRASSRRELMSELAAYVRALVRGLPLPEHRQGRLGALQGAAYRAILLVMVLLGFSGVFYWVPERLPERILGFSGLWLPATVHFVLAVLATGFLALHLFMLVFGPAAALRLREMFQPGSSRGPAACDPGDAD